MFSADEKKLLKELVEKELEEVKTESSIILEKLQFPFITTGELSYEKFLKNLLEKLK